MLWYEIKNKSITVSTRIRLARNIEGIPFPSRLSREDMIKTNNMLCNSILSCGLKMELMRIDMDTLGDIEAYAMVERHIISPKFASEREGRILLLSSDESVSIMIGEEDHLRIQVLKSGEKLKEAYELCDSIDTAISEKIKYAFDSDFGFLTECPTNLGTGMRASVMLHLPVLESNGELRNIADAASKIGLTFRGFYGEGSESKASIYQLSNQVTLGISEINAIENLKNITEQVVFKETSALERYEKSALEDLVYRSYGILKYARKLSTDEMMKYVTALMLGERTNIIELPPSVVPISLFINMQPAMIKRINGDIDANERDILRAEFIREKLSCCEY